jgi:hypothetical protein
MGDPQAVSVQPCAPVGVATPSAPIPCSRPGCRNTYIPAPQPKGSPQRYCCPNCRVMHWEALHPRQAMIEWTPAASDHAHAVRGRESKRERILARLRAGSATSYELAQFTHRFSARILELRQAGHVIDREDYAQDGREWSVYRLRSGL